MSGQQTLASRPVEELRRLPFHIAVERLREAEAIGVPVETLPEALPVAEIVTLENVFQHRTDKPVHSRRL
mgnify:FL=1